VFAFITIDGVLGINIHRQKWKHVPTNYEALVTFRGQQGGQRHHTRKQHARIST